MPVKESNDNVKQPTIWTSPLQHVRWEHLVAGVSGGVASTITLHPLDLLKIRFQVHEGTSTGVNRPQYNGIVDAVRTIIKQDGIKGMYQGVTPNVWGAGISWGLYFFFYNAVKGTKLAQENVTTLSASQHIMSAGIAGICTLSITNPIWVAKTRLCLQYDKYAQTSSRNVQHYNGMFDCLTKIYKADGVRGLYKGFIPGIIGVSHGALQFMAYEELKKAYNKHKNVPLDNKFSSAEYLTFAAISKVFAATITYPYQVVRARLQDQHRSYKGVIDCVMQTWRVERLYGFYKGIPPYLLHVTPNICIVLLVYESIVTAAENHRKDHQDDVRAGTNPPHVETLAQELSGKPRTDASTQSSSSARSAEDIPAHDARHMSLLQTVVHYFKS